METRKHLAAEKKRQNTHNCAQAVVCTYCDLVGLDAQTALDIAGAYGTGMGNMEGTCGALVGGGMVIGLATKDRVKSRARMKEMMEKFQARNGATQCRLLNVAHTGGLKDFAAHHFSYRCKQRLCQLAGSQTGEGRQTGYPACSVGRVR